MRDHARPAPPARLYFFLNGAVGRPRGGTGGGAARRGWGWRPADVRVPAVTGPPPRAETELQVSFSGSVTLGAAGGGDGRTLEAQPGRAAGQARGSDAGQSVPARGACGLSISQCDRAGVVSPRDLESQLPVSLTGDCGDVWVFSPSSLRSGIPSRQPSIRATTPSPWCLRIQIPSPITPPFGTWAQDPHFWSPASFPATH